MKKLLYVIPVFVVFGLVTNAYAANNGAGAQTGQQVQQQDRIQDPANNTGSPLPSGNQVQNQNQVTTQNQGEETQLQVATQQMQQLMDMEGFNQDLVNQIRTIAQEQVQAQTQIQAELNKLESKSGFMKKLFGTDYGAINNLKQQLEQNRLRIKLLTELQNQVTNQADETQLQEAVLALTEQNTSLEEQIEAEESIGSLLGWLVKLFYK
ncbi:MAG TPA: hypothetical protein VI795_03520 [Patescibacteria group bacterium]|nr:hypothetical protein [Patescibacteria group bacterium]